MATSAVSPSKYDDYDFPTTSPETKAGHPGHTTPEQDAKVEQLRSELEKEGYTKRLDTLTLLRFLRARKFDVALAKTMFVDTEKWRKEFGTDDLARDFVYTEKPDIFKYYPQYYHKTDKDGRPVYIEALGNVNIDAMMKITTDERMLKNLVAEYERLADPRLPACSRKAGKLLETCCSVIDLKGVSLMKAPSVYGYLTKTSGVSQNYYPERLGKLYVINAPWGFSSVFSMIKGFLDPVTVEKIHVLGSGYQSELLKQVPAENLPKQYGGTCECQGGCEYSDMGPWQEPEWAKEPKWAAPKGDKDVPQTEAESEKKAEAEAQAASEPTA